MKIDEFSKELVDKLLEDKLIDQDKRYDIEFTIECYLEANYMIIKGGELVG